MLVTFERRQDVRQRARRDRLIRSAAFRGAAADDDAKVVRAHLLHAEEQRAIARLREIDGRRHAVRRVETELDARAVDGRDVGRERDDADGRDRARDLALRR